MPQALMGSLIFAAVEGFADTVPVSLMKDWEKGLSSFLKDRHSAFLKNLEREKALKDSLKAQLKKILEEFQAIFKQEAD